MGTLIANPGAVDSLNSKMTWTKILEKTNAGRTYYDCNIPSTAKEIKVYMYDTVYKVSGSSTMLREDFYRDTSQTITFIVCGAMLPNYPVYMDVNIKASENKIAVDNCYVYDGEKASSATLIVYYR